ncbi:hypothetical protein HPB50_016436 [Hyalomma asiaticum]|uniref:Uncharacterized protein n=1 Tax=Hyalomma asiaticum TaxID=266040 RepID=A0ACB7RZH4_HYAAI|nr:hypothetical protein HPB50_016436 [Hyalomma asiaticum]
MSQDGVGEEEDLSPEEMLKWRQTHIYDAKYQDSLRKDAIAATAKAAVWQQMVSRNNKVRPPKLPEGSYKAIFRIRGGFNASRFSHFQLSQLLSTAAGFPATMELCQDIITVDPTTNTITLSTESYDRLTKYLAIKSLKAKTTSPKVDKTPPTPNSKPPLQTKKQGPLPKKNQEEEWPPLSATPSGNKSSPPQKPLISTTRC